MNPEIGKMHEYRGSLDELREELREQTLRLVELQNKELRAELRTLRGTQIKQTQEQKYYTDRFVDEKVPPPPRAPHAQDVRRPDQDVRRPGQDVPAEKDVYFSFWALAGFAITLCYVVSMFRGVWS